MEKHNKLIVIGFLFSFFNFMAALICFYNKFDIYEKAFAFTGLISYIFLSSFKLIISYRKKYNK
ncbi:hypothetical protein I3900191A7_00680 [Clostridium baratii]|uniref:Uncharacterized protein n=1 Tax=Clostridium nitritogenes TaxID=83340 RepID=A0ABP3XAA8_9CLOT